MHKIIFDFFFFFYLTNEHFEPLLQVTGTEEPDMLTDSHLMIYVPIICYLMTKWHLYIWYNWHLLYLAQVLLSYSMTLAYGPYCQPFLKALDSISRNNLWRKVVYLCLSFPMPPRSPNFDTRVKRYAHFSKCSRKPWYPAGQPAKIWAKPIWTWPNSDLIWIWVTLSLIWTLRSDAQRFNHVYSFV